MVGIDGQWLVMMVSDWEIAGNDAISWWIVANKWTLKAGIDGRSVDSVDSQ